jgi:hypothetical protein
MTVLKEIEKGGESFVAKMQKKEGEYQKILDAIEELKIKFPGCPIGDDLILGDTGAKEEEKEKITDFILWSFGILGQKRMLQRSLEYSHMLENASLDWYFQGLIRYLTTEYRLSVEDAAKLVLKKTVWMDVVPVKAEWNSRKEKWFKYLTEDLHVLDLSFSLLTKILKEFPKVKIYAVGDEAKEMLDRLRPEFGDRIVQERKASHGMRLKGGFARGREIVRSIEEVIIPIARDMVEDPSPRQPFDSESVQKIESYAKIARPRKTFADRKKNNNFDITDMDYISEPIAKSLGKIDKIKSAASKTPQSEWIGVVWNNETGKWLAQIYINKKKYYIGHYDDDYDAGLAYHRVKAKYVDEEAVSKLEIDITDMDYISEPIAKAPGIINKIKTVASRNPQSEWMGVHWDKTGKKWRASISINKKRHCLGFFDDDCEAGKIYHRVKAKYVDGKAADAVII